MGNDVLSVLGTGLLVIAAILAGLVVGAVGMQEYCKEEAYKMLPVEQEVACFHGCQQIPRTNSTQPQTCYDYCENRYKTKNAG
jgi:hypothetical protein